MTRAGAMRSPGRRAPAAALAPRRLRLPEPVLASALLALHASLLGLGIANNSVTYDENLHLASGVVAVTRGNLWISAVNPPLVKAACGLAALAAGARPPADSALARHDQFDAAESFMRVNASRYGRVFTAGRLVIAALSVLLGLLVWRVARGLYGRGAGILALALYALCPEALAHGGLVTLDLATALGFFAALAALVRFARSRAWRDWALLALACAATFLTRFTAWLLLGVIAAVAAVAIARRLAASPRRLAAGVALLLPVALLALALGYPGEMKPKPLSRWRLESRRFLELKRAFPRLVLPLPDAYLAGLDHQAFESQPGVTPTYLFGRILRRPVWYYTPVAVAVKWPLALWAALLVSGVVALYRRGASSRARGGLEPRGPPAGAGPGAAPDAERRLAAAAFLALPLALFASSMFLVQLNVGVRYLLPSLPPLFVLAAGAILPPGGSRGRTWIAGTIVAIALIEAGVAAPFYLSFFNGFAGGPGNGDRIVNDSNVDIGQGLIALRRELGRRGIGRIHLAYHGMTDPGVYGIDYVPYLGGMPGTESDWIAISSYYFVGLSQRMMTSRGRTPFVQLDFRPLWARIPDGRPARCMYLFKIR